MLLSVLSTRDKAANTVGGCFINSGQNSQLCYWLFYQVGTKHLRLDVFTECKCFQLCEQLSVLHPPWRASCGASTDKHRAGRGGDGAYISILSLYLYIISVSLYL